MRETLLTIALLATLKYLFEEGLHSSLLVRVFHALTYGTVILISHYLTQHVSRNDIEQLLYSSDSLRDISLFVMIDLLYVIYLCLNAKRSKYLFKRCLAYLPPLLFLPTLFYLRLNLFYLFPGYSFMLVTVSMIVITVLLTLLIPYLWRTLAIDRNSSAELLILLSFATFLFVVFAGVLHPDSAVVSHQSPIDWVNVVGVGMLIFIGCLLGFLWHKYLQPHLSKIIKHLTS